MSSAGFTGELEKGSGKMWYETFIVEIGAKEIFVDAYGSDGDDPKFKVEAGTDWEGFPVPLSDQEQAAAINWVRKNYGI